MQTSDVCRTRKSSGGFSWSGRAPTPPRHRFIHLLHRIFFKQHNEPWWADAASFIALFLIILALFAGAFRLFSIHQQFSELAGITSVPLLQFFGANAALTHSTTGTPLITGSVNDVPFTAELVQLCGGGLELAVLFAAMLASRDRTLRHRLKGLLLGAFVVAVFNPLRITFTLLLVGSPLLPLFHDILFRGMLALVLVGAYALWYYSSKSEAG